MSYNDYSPKPVSGTIIGISCTCIVAALPLIGLTVVSKPAHPAARGTRIAWYLTGFAALVLLSSHITPLVTAIRLFLGKNPRNVDSGDTLDLGPVAFALQGLTLIFEIATCRAIFYATLPLGVTRAKKWTFIILDMFSFGALFGTFIGALVGTVEYESGMCYSKCTSPREVASVFFDNGNMSGGMHFTSLFSLIVVFAGAICAWKWSPHSPLARSLRISLPILAAIQWALTVVGFSVWLMIWGSESWNEEDYDPIYYASIPFWFVQLVVLWFVQLALRRNPTGVLPVEGTDREFALKEQTLGRAEATAAA